MNPVTPPASHSGRVRRRSATALAALIATGCASTPAPDAEIAASNAAIIRADRSGAPTLAPQEMQEVGEKRARLGIAMAAKDYRRARWLAQETQVDAELAEAKARTAKAVRALP